MNNSITKLPEIGKVYAFYDDGKIGMSRQYLAMVTRIIPFDSKEAIRTIFGEAINDDVITNDKRLFCHPLKTYWKYNVQQFNWVFAEETDYFIECAIPIYDEHLIYFARTKKGKWFSFEVQNDWQCGFLDVEGINDEYLEPELKDKRNKNEL